MHAVTTKARDVARLSGAALLLFAAALGSGACRQASAPTASAISLIA